MGYFDLACWVVYLTQQNGLINASEFIKGILAYYLPHTSRAA